MAADYDSPWKEAIDRWLERFIAFYFPLMYLAIDWSRGYEILDKELQQVVRDAELGRRYADKLVKVWLADGTATWLLAHVEIQGWREGDLARRVFVYNYRIFDRYNVEVVSLVVLADSSPTWRPDRFGYGRWGSRTEIHFSPVKLLDYAGQETVLEADPNPFAAITLAQLKALETQGDPAGRHAWKLRLVRGLYDRGFSAQDVRELFRILDWMLELPPPLERSFWQEMERFEEERHMPYVTSVERIGIEKGLQQGTLKERLVAIEMVLELRFGADGLALMPVIRQVQDLATLLRIRDTAKTAVTLDEVRQAIP